MSYKKSLTDDPVKEEIASLLEKEEPIDLILGIELKQQKRHSKVKLISLLLVSLALILFTLRYHPYLLETYYHSSTLQPGTYSANAKLEKNPLPLNSLNYADVPFAVVDTDTYSISKPKIDSSKSTASNGTHFFQKTVILISLDGVRADYLDLGLTPHLLSVAEAGLRADFLKPVFPSLTFPNHYSLLTGLYPSSHGIVANDFFDPELQEEFVYTDPSKSWDAKWWLGEPIWATAVRNGLRSANLMWPSPPKHLSGISPTYWFPFQNDFSWDRKLSKLLSWIDLKDEDRPQLIIGYLPEVDQVGHSTGTHSDQLKSTLVEMDNFAKNLFKSLEKRNLLDIVEIIFVSDHGMTDTDNERLIFLDEILGPEGFAGIDRNEGWPNAGLRFKDHVDQAEMLKKLLAASELTLQSDGTSKGFNVYTPETMPEKYHFSGHERIAPIYVVCSEGWAITSHHDFHVTMNGDYQPKGNHGYDNDYPSMHAMFIAHGPFVQKVKSTRIDKFPENFEIHKMNRTEGFANLEIYNLVSQLLGIEVEGRAKNNGTDGFWEGMITK